MNIYKLVREEHVIFGFEGMGKGGDVVGLENRQPPASPSLLHIILIPHSGRPILSGLIWQISWVYIRNLSIIEPIVGLGVGDGALLIWLQ